MTIRVVDAGWATTIQDRGRLGMRALGVPRAGAVDRAALDFANRLVGNRPDAAGLETAGGLTVEATTPLIAATSGDGQRHTLRAGDRLRVDPPDGGMWGYLAVRGGVDVDPVLGSRSRDTLSGLGPEPVEASSVLPVGADPGGDMPVDLAPPRPLGGAVRIWPGPHADRLGGIAALIGREWTVQQDVSRVGLRLSRHEFPRVGGGDATMPSIGLVEGAIQVTAGDEPIVMLANHPTTGGYPVIAVVDPDDLSIVAQARPGSTLRFRA